MSNEKSQINKYKALKIIKRYNKYQSLEEYKKFEDMISNANDDLLIQVSKEISKPSYARIKINVRSNILREIKKRGILIGQNYNKTE